MENQTILIKLKQRLDKLDSADYGNVETWMYLEAFNKAQVEWVRRQLEGINQTRTGAETTTRRIDDLQYILVTKSQTATDNGIYWSFALPADYLQFNRVSTWGKTECCPARAITIFPSVEADRDVNLADTGKAPNFEWAQAFCTISNKQVNIYTNNQFDIQDTTLTYYRVPANIEINGVMDPYTGIVSATDVICEAADNIVEILIDEAANILAEDIQSYQRASLLGQAAERST